MPAPVSAGGDSPASGVTQRGQPLGCASYNQTERLRTPARAPRLSSAASLVTAAAATEKASRTVMPATLSCPSQGAPRHLPPPSG